jgi:hypothetical protein
VKPLDCFHKRKSSPDGHQYDCKECLANPPKNPATVDEDAIRENQARRLAESIIAKHGHEIPAGEWSWREIIDMFPVCCVCRKRKPLTDYASDGTIRSTACKECE